MPDAWKTARDVLGTQTTSIPATYNPDLTAKNFIDLDMYALLDEINGMETRKKEINKNIMGITERISELDRLKMERKNLLTIAEKEQKKFNNILFGQSRKYRIVAESSRKDIKKIPNLQKKHREELNNLKFEAESINQKIISANDEISKRLAKYNGKDPAPGTESSHWGQTNAPFNNDSAHRDSKYYAAVINQFGVENNPRYKQDNNTYCNIFAGDVARFMDVPFPTKGEWSNKKDNMTIAIPELWRYFTDNNAPIRAANNGWRELPSSNLKSLETHVNSGKLALILSKGHVAVVRPSQNISDFRSIKLAQAGAVNSNYISVGETFGGPLSNNEEVKIFIID